MPLTHSLGRRLSSLARRHRPGVPPETLLPVELWDYVFHELPDYPLLTISGTCRTFNALCMPIFLLRKGIPSDSLAAGDLAILPHLITALQLSFYTPPIQSLSCQFWAFRTYEHLRSLRNLIYRSSSIKKLELLFDGFLSVTSTTVMLGQYSARATMDLFRDIAYAMSARFSGPVVIVGPHDIFTCHPRDVRRWKIYNFHFSGGFGNYISSAFKSTQSIFTTVRLHNGATAKVHPLGSILSAHIYEIPSITKRPDASSTLIVLNHQHITSIVLGDPDHAQTTLDFGDELSVILPCITLPALDSVTLNTDNVDAVILSQFLARHRTLLSVAHGAGQVKNSTEALISPAVALPELNRVNATVPMNMIRLLDAFEASPKLSNLGFHYDRSSPQDTAALKTLFRRISRRPKDTYLQLVLPPGTTKPMDEEERAIAGSLNCIRSVQIACLRLETAANILPWLALLPRLQSVDLRFLLARVDAVEKTVFISEVMAALPAEVEVL
ncbi:hypothetical protein B0H11DRAFT_2119601, partial [Mycena galericulata]